MPLHIIKLCVGVDSVDELRAWRAEQKRVGREPVMHTRQSPKRCDEVLEGGSLYWVIKGVVRCRQAIVAVDTLEDGPKTRCEMRLHEALVLTEPLPRRAFQGWRYLDPAEAPLDLDPGIAADLPSDLAAELRALGAW
jgi:hypothetical protein